MDVFAMRTTDLFRGPSPTDIEAIPPPVETKVQVLPFYALTWENFERICARLIATDRNIVDVHRYGVQGEEQKGIDLLAERYVEDNQVELWCFQCKKWEQFNPTDLRVTLREIQFEADKYVVIISCYATVMLRDIARQRPNTDLWDAEDLSRKLKDQCDIVEDFFGLPWVRAFCNSRPSGTVVRKGRVQIILDYELGAVDRHKLDEMRRSIARISSIDPGEVVIRMTVEGTVRIVLELPVAQAEELLSLYREQDPRLSEVIERFRIVNIEDLRPPTEPPEPGGDDSGGGSPGPTGLGVGLGRSKEDSFQFGGQVEPATLSQLVQIQPNLGREFAQLGDYEEAEAIFNRTLNLISRIGEPELRFRAVQRYIDNIGQLDVSEPTNKQQVAELLDRTSGVLRGLEPAQQASVLPDLGRQFARVGDFWKAEDAFTQTLDIASRIKEPQVQFGAIQRYIDNIGQLDISEPTNRQWTGRLLKHGAEWLDLQERAPDTPKSSRGYLTPPRQRD